jgi:DNA-directed RNA polymerase subunit RPC12/RpoP
MSFDYEKLDDNTKQCKHIADAIELVVSGDAYKCEHCGDHFDLESAEQENESGETVWKCPHCDHVTEYEPDQVSMLDYFDDCLDIEYRIGGDRKYRSVELCVAWGGPGIYVDTESKQVKLYWWGDTAHWNLSSDACESIDEAFQELYELC